MASHITELCLIVLLVSQPYTSGIEIELVTTYAAFLARDCNQLVFFFFFFFLRKILRGNCDLHRNGHDTRTNSRTSLIATGSCFARHVAFLLSRLGTKRVFIC